MKPALPRGLALAALWLGLTAATPVPPEPPPPDLTGLVPFVTAPLEKPPIPIPALARPVPPAELPALPAVAVLIPAAPDKPIAPIRSARTLPCVGAWLGIPSESLECGRARFQRGEYEEAGRALEPANRAGAERDILVEARYWLAETQYRLGRVEAADALFRQVTADGVRGEFGPWALHGSGWTALRMGDGARARDAFAQLLAAAPPPALDGWARHGHGLALALLGRWDEAVRAWKDLVARRVPPPLGRDVAFWHGEALQRTGDMERAAGELARFTRGGAHPLLPAGLVRLGWALLHGRKNAEAVTAFRTALASRGPDVAGPERDAAEAGLALALVASGDTEGARRLVQPLETRAPAWATPALLRLAAAALDAQRPPEAQAIVQTLLAAALSPPVRAWVLLVSADAHRLGGGRDEARTQYDLARGLDAAGPTGRLATFRLAQVNFELREFAQAASDVAPLVTEGGVAEDLRASALLLQGEAAYYAGDHATATTAYRRVAAESSAGAGARLALAWTALRQGQAADARRQFLEFATAAPSDPHAADAFVLASELMLGAGDLKAADATLEQIVTRYASSPRADFARLNRAILLVRAGQGAAAEAPLRDWIARSPFPPLLGRAYGALGAALLASGKAAEAGGEFTLAQREGLGPLASLGLGSVGVAQRRWDDAARDFGDARDTGPAPIAAQAEYGLAVVAFQRGRPADFVKFARVALDANPRGPMAPRLLYAMTAVGADQKDWNAALGAAKRLVTDFPAAPTADDALARVGIAATKAGAWPVAQEAWTLLRARYPQSPFVEDSRLAFADVQMQTGNITEARVELERFVAVNPTDPRTGAAWLALGRARAQTGDAAGALEAFKRAPPESATAPWPRDTVLSYARLLAQARRWAEARTVVERVLRDNDAALAAEAAAVMGDTYQGQGEHLAAVEYYMTAAYVAPQTPAGRQALLGAGRAFAALKQVDAAEKVYRKLLAQGNLPGDLADAARRGLAEIKR